MTSQAHPAPDPDGTKRDGVADSETPSSRTDSAASSEDPAGSSSAAEHNKQRREDTADTATDADTAESDIKPLNTETANNNNNNIVLSSSRKSRPPYKYDPKKITIRFLFANRDGLAVTVECKPSDTVGEVKGALISVWPDGELINMDHLLFVSSESACSQIYL